MLLMNIKNWFIIKIPVNKKKDFDTEINGINLLRAKITSLAFLIMEIFMFVIYVIFKKSTLFEYPNTIYLCMYLLMIIVMTIFFIIFLRLEKDIEKNVNKIQSIGIAFSTFILLWCAVISILDQHSSGQVIVYCVAIISIAVCPFYKPLTITIMYLSVHILFLILLSFFQESEELLFSNYINTTANLITSLAVSRMLYKSKSIDIINKLIIQDKNEEINDINEKLQKSNEQLEKLSVTDSLTGLLNRRKFDELLDKEWKTCKRCATPISLMMIDIDYFKRFNDIYGHQAGDYCIIQIAKVLSNTAQRSSDIVARYGGEEYIVALPYTENKNANILAEKIRSKIDALKIRHEDSLVADYVTISLGVYTVVPTNENSISELIFNADKELYKEKALKRNTEVILEL